MKLGLALFLIAGCGLSPSGTSHDPDDSDSGAPGSPGNPSNPGTTVPPKPVADGTYRLVNQVDVTVEALLPAQIERAVVTLRDLSTNPAHALITTADEVGVPAVGDLYGALPGPLKDRLEGWINDEIAKVTIDGVPVPTYAGQVAALADTALTRFALASELTVHGATASHRLTALDLGPAGIAVVVPFGGIVGDLLTQDTEAASAGGLLLLGEQHFGVNYGEYVWRGLEQVSRRRTGGSLRDALGGAIRCPDLARAVGGKCVLGVCVGHVAELTEICEAGLDAIVDLAHDRIAELRLEVLHLAGGAAALADDDRDGIADRITGGTWQAELDLGAGLRHTPATFSGAR